MGLLARLYRYGQVAYVGGGFTDGIHSTLEAAAWGCPVLFGPKHRKFPEAQGLIVAGAAVEVKDAADVRNALLHWSNDPAALQAASEAALRYVQERTGGAGKVADAVVREL
jgi:3-deoxy-D-manno-octulosonic-acid transferase